jgi:predicted nuclease of predicted toxin-antitoxin system
VKFLIDAHLPPSLCRALVAEGHDAIHTSGLPKGNATTDEIVRSVAIAEGRVLVTKDLDFFDSLVLHGAPPKLVLVRCGNLRKGELVALLVGQLDAIVSGLERGDLVEVESPAERPQS